jgi:hypothetical protein
MRLERGRGPAPAARSAPAAGVLPGPRRLELPVLFLHLLALALTLGAPVFFGAIVAPSAFRVLPTRDLAASLQSPILTDLCRGLEAAFVVLLATTLLLTRWWEAARLPRALASRAAVLGIIGAVVIEKLLIPPIDRIRQEAPGLIDDLPAADPSRILLDRYHRLATSLFAVEIGAALVILLVTARLAVARRSIPRPAAPPREVPKLLDLS